MTHATAIEWMTALADARGMRADVWNWAEGCTAAGEGCRNCWAAAEVYIRGHQTGRTGERFAGLAEMRGGRPVFNGTVRVIEADLTKPLRTKRPTVYFCSRFDPFHEAISDADRDRAFAIMALCPQHLFLVLTKRPERLREYFAADEARRKGVKAAYVHLGASNCWLPEWPLPNLWLGTSIWDQDSAEAFVPPLLETPAALRFLSCEPLLGPVDIDRFLFPYAVGNLLNGPCEVTPSLDWVIAGGESGPKARPSHPDWFRSLRDQCAAAGVPFLFKQWGEWAPPSPELEGPDGIKTTPKGGANWHRTDVAGISGVFRVGKKAAGRLLDGREHLEVPA